uniref:Uncharacterized protein n=3 Tax=unclassified bacterial viruses TaxID=12333 RepID=A0AAU6VZV5_9VIRU
MGSNSTDALEAFMEDFMSRCLVVGGKIITPAMREKNSSAFRPPIVGHVLPSTRDALVDGRPDQKRGQ